MTTLVNQVPRNGTNDQVLKKTGSDYDAYQWESILEVPSGGSTGQVLTKTATGYEWQTPTGGGMQYAGSVNTNLTTSGAQYTVPSGNLFEGQVITNSTGGGNEVFHINTTSNNSLLGHQVAPNQRVPLKLGNGSYIRVNSFFQEIKITGYRLSN